MFFNSTKLTRAIIDFNQICFAQFYGSVQKDDELEDRDDKILFFKHCVLNKLADINKTLKANEIILAMDSGSWREDVFTYYKAKRKEQRADNSIEFNLIFECIDELKKDLSELNYKVIAVQKAEGDDVIAALVDKFLKDEQTEKIYIVSTDKDFQQLTNERVLLYNHLKGEVINCADKDVFLIKLIMSGDTSDGIPNMLSDDDTFVNSAKRQKACGEVKQNKILTEGLQSFLLNDAIARKNYERNQKLITLSEEYIPANIWQAIQDEYEQVSSTFKRKNAIMIANFFRTHKLNGLVQKANDFI